MPEKEIKNRLLEVVRAYITVHEINCPEAIMQNDEVMLTAHELVESVCEVVGYWDCDKGEIAREDTTNAG